jgi:hypothetical protein
LGLAAPLDPRHLGQEFGSKANRSMGLASGSKALRSDVLIQV